MALRGIFAVTMALSLLGSVVVGGVYAFWTGSVAVSAQAAVGTVAFTVNLTPTANPVGPPGGPSVVTANGTITNNSSFSIAMLGPHTVTIDGVRAGPPHGPGGCDPMYFSGITTWPLTPPPPLEPGGTGWPFSVRITVRSDAPDPCQGDTLDYTVRIGGQG